MAKFIAIEPIDIIIGTADEPSDEPRKVMLNLDHVVWIDDHSVSSDHAPDAEGTAMPVGPSVRRVSIYMVGAGQPDTFGSARGVFHIEGDEPIAVFYNALGQLAATRP